MAHEFHPHVWWHEGRETNDRRVRIAYTTEEEWVEQWRLAVQLAAEGKKRGALNQADRRIAAEVEARSRQGTADRNIAPETGFMVAATGLLTGVQGLMGQSRMAAGWGGDCTY